MALEQCGHQLVVVDTELLERHRRPVAARGERLVLVEHVGDATAHAGREVPPGRPQNHDGASGHVLAGVVADALDDGHRTGVADAEAFTGHSADERLTRGCAVERDVADDDVVLGASRRSARWQNDETSAGESLAHVVVRLTAERQRDAARKPGAERLTRGTVELDVDGAVGKAASTVASRDLAAEHRSDTAMDVAHRQPHAYRIAAAKRITTARDQLVVEHIAKVCALLPAVPAVVRRLHLRHHEQRCEVEPACLPVMNGGIRLDEIDAADHVLEAPEAEPRHPAAHVLGEEAHEGNDVLRPAGEPRAQHRVLRGDADRTGVEVADAHHHAARRDQRRRRERELVSAEQRTHNHVAPGLHLAVRQERDPAAQALPGEHLLRFGEAELPRHARVLDRGQR